MACVRFRSPIWRADVAGHTVCPGFGLEFGIDAKIGAVPLPHWRGDCAAMEEIEAASNEMQFSGGSLNVKRLGEAMDGSQELTD